LTVLGRSEDSCWCNETNFGAFVAFGTYAANIASEGYTLFIAVDLILNVQSPFTNFKKNLRMYNMVIAVYASMSAILLVWTENYGSSLIGFCSLSYYSDRINAFLINYFVLVCSATVMQVAAILYVERRFRRRSEVQDLIWQDRDKIIRLSYEYALYYMLYWFVVITFRSILFVEITEDNVDSNGQLLGEWEGAINGLAFLEGLRSLPSMLLWIRWGHYLVDKIRGVDKQNIDRDDNDSLAPQLNESLRSEMVNYMQVGLTEIATATVSKTGDTRQVYIRYVKEKSRPISSPRKAYEIATHSKVSDDGKGACLRCLCPFLAFRISRRLSIARTMSTNKTGHASLWKMHAVKDASGAGGVVKELMASHFTRLRKAYGIETEYQSSLRNINAGKLTGGRSGSFFFFTSDHRFAIKTMDPGELAVLTQIVTCCSSSSSANESKDTGRHQNGSDVSHGSRFKAASSVGSDLESAVDGSSSSRDGAIPYVDYILRYKSRSLIVKIFGVYELRMTDYRTNVIFYIMENIFPPSLFMDEKYDIKGMSGEGAPLCPGPIVHRKSKAPKKGTIEKCRFCHKTFRIGEEEDRGAGIHCIWCDETRLAKGEFIEYREERKHSDSDEADETKMVTKNAGAATKDFGEEEKEEANATPRTWNQAKVVRHFRSAHHQFVIARNLETQEGVELDFATQLNVEIRPLDDEHVNDNMWTLAAKRFASRPFSNGWDGKYERVKGEVRRRWGYSAANDGNKPLMKQLALNRGDFGSAVARNIMRMRHALQYRICTDEGKRRSDPDAMRWRIARRRFVSGRSHKSSNDGVVARREMCRGLIFVDASTQDELRIPLPSLKRETSSLKIERSVWRTRAYFSNIRYSKCTVRRFHEPVQDLMEGDLKSKIILEPGEAMRVMHNIKRDSKFLMKHGIMDYSLLMGVQNHRTPNPSTATDAAERGLRSRYMNSKTYHLGIIDILRKFNFAKKIENFNKQVLLCRGRRISAVRPPTYKMYFDQYIGQHVFATTPRDSAHLTLPTSSRRDVSKPEADRSRSATTAKNDCEGDKDDRIRDDPRTPTEKRSDALLRMLGEDNSSRQAERTADVRIEMKSMK